MQTKALNPGQSENARPWYMHRWPWLLMLGPALVIVAGAYTTWLAASQPDALVVDDYYKEGKAINQDLHRDRIAAGMKLDADIRYDAAAGALTGTVRSHGLPHAEKLRISLIHSTRPERDIHLQAQADQDGNFSAALPMLDIARWQVLVESERRDWRLDGVWLWPKQSHIVIKADKTD